MLADYHDPFFRQLLLARLSQHPGAPSLMTSDLLNLGRNDQLASAYGAKPMSAHHDAINTSVIDGQMQPPDDITEGPMAFDAGLDGIYGQNTLNQLLETPDWMANPSSMLFFNLENWLNDGAFAANS